MIFPNLTVRENLVATARAPQSDTTHHWTLEAILRLFPELSPRLSNMGNQLSGGEQQMLAIARALMTHPKLLILDEATEGLAPLIRAQIWTSLAELKRQGQAILVIDKNIAQLAEIADRHYVMEKGRVVWQGGSNELMSSTSVKQRYLGV